VSEEPLLREILAALHELPGRIAREMQRESKPRLSATDEAAMQALLAAIYGAVGTRAFTIRSLRAASEFDDLSTSVALRAELEKAGSAHQVGRLLRRAEGHDINGLTITACGKGSDGVLRVMTKIVTNRHLGC